MARTNNSLILQYIRQFIIEDEFLVKIKKSPPPEKFGIQISPEEGKLIYLLLQLMNAKHVLEIGTFVGYSTAWIAKALPLGGQVISIEKSIEHYNIAVCNLQPYITTGQVKLLNGDAQVIINSINDITFDAVFIDANKQAYPLYLELCYDKLRPGGMIIADNIFLFGSVYDHNIKAAPKLKAAIEKFNQAIANDQKYESVIIPTPEGLTIAIKK